MDTVLHSKVTMQPPALVDDPRVRETYADSFVGVVFNNGNLHLTFASVQADHTQDPAPNMRKVVARIVLPAATAAEVHGYLGHVMTALESQGFVKKAPMEGLTTIQ